MHALAFCARGDKLINLWACDDIWTLEANSMCGTIMQASTLWMFFGAVFASLKQFSLLMPNDIIVSCTFRVLAFSPKPYRNCNTPSVFLQVLLFISREDQYSISCTFFIMQPPTQVWRRFRFSWRIISRLPKNSYPETFRKSIFL